MRCGSHRSQGTQSRPDPSKAATRLFQKAKRLGPLGSCIKGSHSSCSSSQPSDYNTRTRNSIIQHQDVQPFSVNSTRSPGIFKQKNKEGGHEEPPPPKQESQMTSRYWSAHLGGASAGEGPGKKETCDTSINISQTNFSRPETEIGEPSAKKVKVSPPSAKHALACRGCCPAVWTIDMYCPHCHG